ncbi:MAG TPA: helix-turn-helix transcriptional regulator [Candidatus Paceibacterota bacterium]|nr:helix-turn-helix transcriptional regulator [Candidatus Paceibacterota bacterium]HPY12992.1 helix-turn-helix transcriptional regulator [Candidatus Paceibacterota bacterium]HQB26932.1 helix-turn-helix transcriptional regulator [Candidatus Paceibacterota bacterium]HQF40717.1 helix-turn-helix transcriptional regulator [Candidatus Paceibacterota bacterium]HQJ83620.1 helix-turn-helix transcriptional regulator [Candidatus Paceibacterota bacterium]
MFYRTPLSQKTNTRILLVVDMSDAAKRLGENIRRIRLENGMTQGDLCRLLKLDRAYMSNVESGKKNPTLATIERIAVALEVTSDKLLK